MAISKACRRIAAICRRSAAAACPISGSVWWRPGLMPCPSGPATDSWEGGNSTVSPTCIRGRRSPPCRRSIRSTAAAHSGPIASVPACSRTRPCNAGSISRAFTAPAPYKFGNSGRDILYGPGTVQFDIAAMKNFYLRESRAWRLQFRAEAFNLANTPQLNNPNVNIGANGAGQINNAGSPATFQRTSRQVQLALKLYW